MNQKANIAIPQVTISKADIDKILGSVAGRARFARWLNHNGATLLMPDIMQHEVLVFLWVRRDGKQVTERVSIDPRNSNRVNVSKAVIEFLTAFRTGRAVLLSGSFSRLKIDNKVEAITAIIKRDGFCCFYCGKTAEEVGEQLTIEHFVAISHGGTNHLDNLALACKSCNVKAGNLSVAEKIRIRDAIRGAKECAA